MTPGTLSISPLVFADLDETRLVNADGYSRWWNPTEFTLPGMFGYTHGVLANTGALELTATVNPFKYFADILDAESQMADVQNTPLDSDGGRGIFTAGSSNTRRYQIQFPMDPGPVVKYGYAVNASWAAPIPNPPVELPDDFPIEANQPEAFRIVMADTINTLYYHEVLASGGGALRIQINVHDWQGQFNGNLSDEINAVRIFAPGLMTGGIDAVLLDESPTNALYIAELTGFVEPVQKGEHLIICQVGSTSGTYSQTGAPAPDGNISAYQEMIVTVGDPAGCIYDDGDEPLPIEYGTAVAGIVCDPDDASDMYSAIIAPGFEPSGTVTLYSDTDGIVLGIFGHNGEFLGEQLVVDGSASVDLDLIEFSINELGLMAFTEIPDVISHYTLELSGAPKNVAPTNPTDISPEWFLWPEFVWMHEGYAYSFGTRGAWVHWLLDINNPVQVSETLFTTGFMRQAAFSAPYAYFVGERIEDDVNTLGMVDFTDPINPVLYEDIITINDTLESIWMDEQYLYIGQANSGGFNQVKIFDYSFDPLSPTIVVQKTITDIPTDLIVFSPNTEDAVLAVNTDAKVILLFDVSDPIYISTHGSPLLYTADTFIAWDVGSTYMTILVRETALDYMLYHYVLIDSGLSWYAQKILSMNGADIAVDLPYIYLKDTGSLRIYDVSDPTELVSLGSVGHTHDYTSGKIAAEDGKAVILHMNRGLQFFDCADPDVPVATTDFEYVNKPSTGFIHESGSNLVFGDCTFSQNYLTTLDVSDPANLSIQARQDIVSNSTPSYMARDGHILALNNASLGNMALYNVADPLNIAHISDVTGVPESTQPWTIFEGYLYSYKEEWDGSTGYVYYTDISTPSAPVFINVMNFTGQIRTVMAEPGYLYLVRQYSVMILDNADPTSPLFHSNLDDGEYLGGFKDGNYMYILEPANMKIYSLTDPSSPVLESSTMLPGVSATTGTVYKQFAYLVGEYDDVHIVRIWPPDDPEYIGSFYGYEGCDDIVVHNDAAYLFTTNAGLRVFQLL